MPRQHADCGANFAWAAYPELYTRDMAAPFAGSDGPGPVVGRNRIRPPPPPHITRQVMPKGVYGRLPGRTTCFLTFCCKQLQRLCAPRNDPAWAPSAVLSCLAWNLTAGHWRDGRLPAAGFAPARPQHFDDGRHERDRNDGDDHQREIPAHELEIAEEIPRIHE